ncbi:hypothetical protein E1B28_001946 [Marasmius oreades]|uniref:Uncharacterized protein n=1 Tax=Marasmius oreades TaxID=181124 RepID=A0A9P8AFQ1_9AGAR|nr:uncharacterized protein E1B28_001946 [Marasmius oreades]KAG7100166.1 hypothetical protein E1B28_001946 [Marasmius oreades]
MENDQLLGLTEGEGTSTLACRTSQNIYAISLWTYRSSLAQFSCTHMMSSKQRIIHLILVGIPGDVACLVVNADPWAPGNRRSLVLFGYLKPATHYTMTYGEHQLDS